MLLIIRENYEYCIPVIQKIIAIGGNTDVGGNHKYER